MSSGASLSGARRRTRGRTGMWCARRRSCWRPRGGRIRRSASGSVNRARRSRHGENAFARRDCRGSRRDRGRVGRGVFPPAQVAEVKALACELPAERGVALSRWSSAELAREAVKRGIVAQVAAVTIWRWLAEDAIRPWNYRSWIFPRDPKFAEKAGRILDLYEGRWEGQLLEPGDLVVCADEKPSIQARARKHPSQPAMPGGDGQLVEHEYQRKGALCYLAAWDVRRASCLIAAPKDGIEPFRRAGRAVHECRALPQGAARVRGRRQRLRAPRPTLDRPPPGRLAEPDPRAHCGRWSNRRRAVSRVRAGEIPAGR
jgi:hypothetical protein